MSRRTLIVVAAAVLLGLSAGGAFAASRYLVTSVNQIKPSVRAKLHGERGPAGPAGAAGAQGPAGAPTSEFAVTGNVAVVSPSAPLNISEALCPTGDLVLSGGWKGLAEDSLIESNEPTTVNGQQGWAVVAGEEPYASDDGVGEESFEATALCAT